MTGRDLAAAQRQGRGVHRFHTQPLQAGHGADDVDDGVDRADLVEMHLLDGRAVHAGFGLGQALEDPQALSPDAPIQAAGGQQLRDVGQAPRFRRAARRDVHLAGPQRAALNGLHPQIELARQVQAVQRLPQVV